MITIAAIINLLVVFRKNNTPFGLVFTWAAFWIAEVTPYITSSTLSSLYNPSIFELH
jgi:hypothetical protein